LDDVVRKSVRAIDPSQLLLLIDTLLRALGTKALTFAALVMTFALFCWAMWLQTLLAFGIAGAFGIAVLAPVLWIGSRQGEDDG